MQSPIFSATLAEQHREELRRQADQARLTRGGRLNGRRREWRASRWWRPATRPALSELAAGASGFGRDGYRAGDRQHIQLVLSGTAKTANQW